ncbi:MAG: transposase [Kiritimatiellia bacterium]
MARKLRVQFEGAIYHVTIRGVERRTIFDDKDDRERFLERLGEAVEEYGVRLYLFCLMTNHAHLLVETPRGNLSAFMHKLQTAYTVYYNLRHKRVGHLMQGRFGAKPVEGDAYLLTLSRYIHLNPVFAGSLMGQPLAGRLAEFRAYPWSSYRGYAGLAKPNDFVDEGPILAMMAAPEKKRRRAYRRFVEAGIAETDDEFLEVLQGSAWGIGGGEFQERIRDLHSDMANQVKRPEDVSFRHAVRKVSPEAVLGIVANTFGMKSADLRKRRYDCVARAVAAQMMGKYAGMNQRDIGGLLNMGTGSAVCRQLKQLRDRRGRGPDLDAHIVKIESALERCKAPSISIIKG